MRWWRRKPVFWTLIGVGAVILLGMASMGQFYAAYRIPTGAMQPNLLPGDFLFARRLSPDAAVRQGEILVFEYPQDRQQDYIKRCVAVAGDTVAVREGILYVNGAVYESALDDPEADHSCIPFTASASDCPEPHTRLDPAAGARSPRSLTFEPLVVPAGHLFMMGDNRYNSLDSRYWGPLPRDHVTARAAFFYWSWDARGPRWERLLRRVR